MKRSECRVPQEEIELQRDFIRKVKEINHGVLKKYSVQTFGCQMNENDSERLAGMLYEMGYTEAKDIKESDVIIFNTCCVRENAEVKVYGHLGALKKLKSENPNMVIAVCGCMMQQSQIVEHIKSKYRHVDLIFGTHNLYKFPEMLHDALNSRETIIDVWESEGSIAENMPIERKDGIKAWVTIMYGCNNFCSYCIVPYVRGRERSRHPDDIINEVSMLGRNNYKEITLLGQNVNSYGKDLENGLSFAGLLKELDKIDGIERIRFMTSHPKDLSDELLEAMKDCKKVCEHLHLPIQSGSTGILKEMNRKYTKEHYLELADKVKKTIPDIALTTDIIVGFPGETEEDFDETIDVIEKARFDMAYTFLYSKRTGTPAAKSEQQVSEETKKLRFEKLLEVQNRISKEINDEYLGKTVEVLVEGYSKNSPNKLTGRTRTNKVVNFKGEIKLVGKLVNVEINKVQTWSLEGEVTAVYS
ncbi:MAG: tRNA (N6-isopentenyl adenosine(37)-C2)-methylthiotransferase MiaB [Bacillota bacterium]|nr:tRNA (N6-isopentenyl adenosine(37)-C2)-methylthiotransferase MiaB [Bacillota bacterium]